MVEDEPNARRVKITAEATFYVTDGPAVERTALDDIAQTAFCVDERSVAEIVVEEQGEIRGNLTAAVSWLADPEMMVSLDVPGIECTGTQHSVEDLDQPASGAVYPEFASLFAACGCDLNSCGRCEGSELTPRTAAVLWSMSQMLADQAYDDVIEHGDEPVQNESAWHILSEYPRITWRHDAVWRRQAARAFDALAADIAAGNLPLPRCPAEEMALHFALRYAGAAVDDGWAGLDGPFEAIPKNANDFNWNALYATSFRIWISSPYSMWSWMASSIPRVIRTRC